MRKKKDGRTGGWAITRREFLKATGSALAGLSIGTPMARTYSIARKTRIRFDIVADLHFPDTPVRGNRSCRQSLSKLAECVAIMNDLKAQFLIELGDFKDEGRPASKKNKTLHLRLMEMLGKH